MTEWTMKKHLEENDQRFHDEIDRLKEEVVFGFYEEEYPLFAQGYKKGINELSSPVTADEVTGYINKIIELKNKIEILERDSRGFRQ